MISRGGEVSKADDLWARLAAPLDVSAIKWRQDGRAMQRDGKFFARFVCYVEANTVRERLDSVVPGEWDLTLEPLPVPTTADDDELVVSFKARLQILGVVREDVGSGRDYKSAASDAFKRAGVRFGIAHELYAYGQNWVQVDGDGKYAKPLEDPGDAYARRTRTAVTAAAAVNMRAADDAAEARKTSNLAALGRDPFGRDASVAGSIETRPSDEPECPKCGGRMWDNRLSKRNPRAPDYKCRNRSCDGVIWPTRSEPEYPEQYEAVDADDDLPF